MRFRVMSFVFGLFLVVGIGARAETGKTAAKEAFREGVKLFKTQRYVQASKAFRRANEIHPNWKLFYNIGQSEAAAKRYGLALEAFEQYLARAGDDITSDRQAEVIGEVKRLRELVGTIEVRGPSGSAVFVDDVLRGQTPMPGPISVPAGIEQRVRVEKDGAELLNRVILVGGSKKLVVSVEEPQDLPVATSEAAAEVPAEKVEDKNRKIRIVGWSMLGVGGAILVSGAVTGGVTAARAGELKSNCPDNKCPAEIDDNLQKSGKNLALATDILLPLGGAVAVTGAILLIIGYKKKESPRNARALVTPLVSPEMIGLCVEGRF